jgi:hypothetical protein
MTQHCLPINHLNQLHNCQVVIDHPTWEASHKRPLTARVIGWTFDTDEDTEPFVEIKYSSDLPTGWANETDTISLSRVQLANSVAIASVR